MSQPGQPALTRGWTTDLAVLRHTGAEVIEHVDHLVVRSRHSPNHHWGNFVLVTDPGSADDATRWVATFGRTFPDAGHIAIGLPCLPTDGSWSGAPATVETDEVLFTTQLPEQRDLADGYLARAFTRDDWGHLLAMDVAENARTGEHQADGYERFSRDEARARRGMVEAGVAQWFGAFGADGGLVSALGIVVCGDVARFQSVSTDPRHRRRGLAAHLLGGASRWASERGCTAWVIVTESTNPAGRLYRSVGFEPDAVQVSAYRADTTSRPVGT